MIQIPVRASRLSPHAFAEHVSPWLSSQDVSGRSVSFPAYAQVPVDRIERLGYDAYVTIRNSILNTGTNALPVNRCFSHVTKVLVAQYERSDK